MGPLFIIFVLFSPLWWALLLVASIGIMVSLELKENQGKWATGCLVTALVLLSIFGSPSIPELLMVNPLWFIGSFIAGYLVGSCCYALPRWWAFCHKKLDEYEQFKLEWLRSKGIADREIPENLKEEFFNYTVKECKDDYANRNGRKEWLTTSYQNLPNGTRKEINVIDPRPKPWNYSGKIFVWLAYWPWSLLLYVFHDMVKNLFIWIRRCLVDMMDGISKAVFKDVSNDFKFEKQPEYPAKG